MGTLRGDESWLETIFGVFQLLGKLAFKLSLLLFHALLRGFFMQLLPNRLSLSFTSEVLDHSFELVIYWNWFGGTSLVAASSTLLSGVEI
jgi:hypothetical protein